MIWFIGYISSAVFIAAVSFGTEEFDIDEAIPMGLFWPISVIAFLGVWLGDLIKQRIKK